MHNALAAPRTRASVNVLTIPWTHVCAHWWSPLPGVCDIGCWERVRKSPQQPQPGQSWVATPAPDSFLVPLPYPFLENRHCLDLEIPYSPLLLSPLRAYKNWDPFPLEVDSSTPAWDMSRPQSSGFPQIKPCVICMKLGLSWVLGGPLLSRGLSEGLLKESFINTYMMAHNHLSRGSEALSSTLQTLHTCSAHTYTYIHTGKTVRHVK